MLPTITETGVLLSLVFIVSLNACADGLIIDVSCIVDPEQREAVVAATKTFEETPTDLIAFDVIIKCVGVGFPNCTYQYRDPVKQKAYTAISGWHSTDFLVQILEKGSDLGVLWALNKIRIQELFSYHGWKNAQKQLATSSPLAKRGGLVTPDAKKALIPLLKRLAESPHKATADLARQMVKEFEPPKEWSEWFPKSQENSDSKHEIEKRD